MKESSRISNVVKNTISGLAQRVVSILAGFLIQLLYIRILGIEYVGISALFASIISVLSLAELGIGNAITYALYRPVAENDHKKITAYVRFYGRVYRLIGGVVLIAGLCVAPFIQYFISEAPDIKENLRVIYLLLLADTVLSYLLIYKSTLLIAAQKNRIVTNVQTCASVVKCIALAVVLLVWKNYYMVLVVFAAITVLQNVAISAFADIEFPGLKNYRTELEKDEVAALMANVRAMALYKISGVVLHSTDNVILSANYGAEKVGILSNYNLVITNVYNLVVQFYTAVSSSVGNLGVSADNNKEYTVFRILNFITFWVYGFCAVAILVLVQPFVELFFGGEFLFSLPIVIVLVFDFYIKGMISPINAFRNAHGLFTQGKYRPLAMACINVVLSIVLLQRWGVIGVFIATVVSRLVTQVWYEPFLIYRRVFKKNVWEYYKEYLGWLFITCLSGCVTWAAARLIPAENLWITLIISGILCLVIPNLAVVLLYGRTNEFQATLAIIRSLCAGRRGKIP